MHPRLLLTVLAAAALLSGCATQRSASRTSSAPAAVNLQQMIVPAGRVGRHKEFPLRATHLTIHSTGSPGGTALAHARGMQAGNFRGRSKWNRTGYMTWHFTVDDQVAIQHLPLNLQGEHADHDGPGNTTSIGIEICEFREPRRQAAALDRGARLAAWVSKSQGIPVSRIVPHYHWPQHHFHHHQKNCPRILLEGGKPGPRWAAYLRKIANYR